MRLELNVPSGIEPIAPDFVSRLFAQDATLWGPDAESEASKRLAWTDLPLSSRPLVDIISALRSGFRERGLTRVVTEKRKLDDVNACFEEVLAGEVPARLVFDMR